MVHHIKNNTIKITADRTCSSGTKLVDPRAVCRYFWLVFNRAIYLKKKNIFDIAFSDCKNCRKNYTFFIDKIY